MYTIWMEVRTWKTKPLRFFSTGNRISKPEKNEENTQPFFLLSIYTLSSSSPLENLWNMRLKVDSCLHRLTDIIYLYMPGFVRVFIVPQRINSIGSPNSFDPCTSGCTQQNDGIQFMRLLLSQKKRKCRKVKWPWFKVNRKNSQRPQIFFT